LLAVAAALLLPAATAGAGPGAPSQKPAPKTTLPDVEDEVMCPICGTALNLSFSPQADRERAFIQREINEGKTKEQIKDDLVQQYGTNVLAEPPKSGFDLTAWLVPGLAMLEPEEVEEALGQAEVKELFRASRVGTIAGCLVTDGKVTRTAQVRLIREGTVVWTGRVGSLRRFKDNVQEVEEGLECGIVLEGYQDVKVGDVLEFFETRQVEQTLE
jgi:cytochrome c-type biogenesis protein CcmH/NrfF